MYSSFKPRIKAILGPTNTGKTHLALERVLSHESGAMGFPLRLLARENYERMVAQKGIHAVALITGEEKIIPPKARWFSCTVEAMPLDRPTECVAIDEIQLCADPERGHIFTERLLHMRGTVETLFLGADTIRPLLRRLVPEAEIESRSRLSKLSYTGAIKLSRIPPRSAIVGFSMEEVYATAELLRRQRGGCAVIMGRLSPRTRNAQVSLYQNREVDYIVATDAIGMGLNLDLHHVYLSGLSKFDGAEYRPLTPQEVAQIAGRAGRGTTDGTFGTTASCPPLPDEIVTAVEAHQFPPLSQLVWRNNELDYSSGHNLLRSLRMPPPHAGLTSGRRQADTHMLEFLLNMPDISALARGQKATRLLWDVCQIPDFQDLGNGSHARLCRHLYLQLYKEGRLSSRWLAEEIASLTHTEGDIDLLMQRQAHLRVYAYISARKDWLGRNTDLQAHARHAEDILSEALHRRLTARFVDARAAMLIRKLGEQRCGRSIFSHVGTNNEIMVEGQTIGHMRGFSVYIDSNIPASDTQAFLRLAQRAAKKELPNIVKSFLQSNASDKPIDCNTGTISWQGVAIARLLKGQNILTPRIALLEPHLLDPAEARQIQEDLQGTFERFKAERLKGLVNLSKTKDLPTGVRGMAFQLLECGGIVPKKLLAAKAPLRPQELRKYGMEQGQFGAFIPSLLKQKALELRALLLSLYYNGAPHGPLALPLFFKKPPANIEFLESLGWVSLGEYMLRIDIATRMFKAALALCRRGPRPLTQQILALAPIKKDQSLSLLRSMGFKVSLPPPISEKLYGPPAPIMISRPTYKRMKKNSPSIESPFSVLANVQFSPPSDDVHPWQRLDSWLWCARLGKTRAICAQWVEGGLFRLNGQRVSKAHSRVRVGDILTIPARGHHNVMVICVTMLTKQRKSPKDVKTMYKNVPEAGL